MARIFWAVVLIMRILMLDVDGVLNSTATWRAMAQGRGCHGNGERAMCPELVGRVNRLVELASAVIVVSSSWRYASVARTRGVFIANGITGRIIGCTPRLESWNGTIYRAHTRADEIQSWLDAHHRPVESFVILDDMDDMGHLQDHLVQTDERVGIQETDVAKALAILERSRP